MCVCMCVWVVHRAFVKHCPVGAVVVSFALSLVKGNPARIGYAGLQNRVTRTSCQHPLSPWKHNVKSTAKW